LPYNIQGRGELTTKKIIKQIKVDVSKCTGCRGCELACSAFHATPKYSSINPARSRIRVTVDELRDVYVPASTLKPNAMAETFILLMEKNTTNATSAGLPAHPEIGLKNLIPVFL
jgi:ferredoxin